MLLLLFAVLLLHAATGFGGAFADDLFGIWVYDALLIGAAAGCLARAVLVERERFAWTMLGAGLLCWTGGEIFYSATLAANGDVPVPSLADAGYLAFYPLAYVGLIALTRQRNGSFPATRWLDGLIVGFAVAALAASLALEPIVDASTSGQTAEVVTNLAYPVADLTLLALVLTATSFTGWRPGPSWMALGLGLIVLAVFDGTYLWQSARETYVEGGLVDAGWPLGALLIATAAWLPTRPAGRTTEGRGLRVALVPAAAALVAIGVQTAERYTLIPSIAAALSLLTLLIVVVRMAISFRDTQANLESREREALTDPLTGMPNRRRLMDDLDHAATTPAGPGRLWLLVLFDLDGFKAYNDSFGHPAGDALLTRLGGRLSEFASPYGTAYRLGGDEFCLLAQCTAAAVDGVVAGSLAALSERGEGFSIGASQGSVLLPAEAATQESAMQLADRRMYANKSGERTSAGSQTRDVLLTALRERQPELHAHILDVAALASEVAAELGLDAEQRDEVKRAAALHDVGKVAIPDAILAKPGPLDPAEWEFMQKHTLIGERIIASAPALVPVARLVRSSHERWDGGGYPDGLRGEEIPIGSRIVGACDAYHAMVAERPYSVAMRPARALEELSNCAGAQFDPTVVAALRKVAERSSQALA